MSSSRETHGGGGDGPLAGVYTLCGRYAESVSWSYKADDWTCLSCLRALVRNRKQRVDDADEAYQRTLEFLEYVEQRVDDELMARERLAVARRWEQHDAGV